MYRSYHICTDLLAHPGTSDSTFQISMLIGADFYWDIVEDHVIRGNGPTAVKSKTGYLSSGPVHAQNSDATEHVFNIMASRPPTDVLERFWTLESMGISQTSDDTDKTDYFNEYQLSSIVYQDGSYTAKLPWKRDHAELPSNYDVATKRTRNLIRRLQGEPPLLVKYDEIITEQERRGFIEKVDSDTPTTGQVHYIPHRPVNKDSTTTPIRIVNDCSSRKSPNLPSLNDCLDSTPPALNDITSILMRFRIHSYAATIDIEKAFLHIGLDEKDRDITCFLWPSDINNPDSPLSTYRFKSVLFGAICSPFILSATLLKHLDNNKHVPAAEIIKRDIYVDNVLSSFENESDLLKYFTESRSLMSNAGMNLRAWTSNSEELRTQADLDGALDSDVNVRILGLRWDPTKDEMSFAERNIPMLDVVTKRTILRYSSQIYDPLGLLSPVTVRAKILLQELWTDKYDWDTPLPDHICETRNQLAWSFNKVTETKFARQYLPSTSHGSETSLHAFVDASVKSYGAAAYLCDQTQARLVMAKNRVAPLKSLTLLQLELMAALAGARLSSHILETLPTLTVTFWSDSQIVLHCLTTTKALKRFVRSRVEEIKQLTNRLPWRYCVTDDNPADLLTRGISAQAYLGNQLWDAGPAWLPNREKRPTWEFSQ